MSARARILVADDEEDVRILVSRILRDMGYAVDVAKDGAEAIEKMEEARPDLLVLDLMMPGVDGWAVLEHVRSRPKPPPVIVLTARADFDSFTRGVREGATAYVFKPFRFHELLATCETVLQRARPETEVVHERRRDPRRVVMAEVRILSRERAPVAVGELVNLSGSGAQVQLPAPLAEGTEVRIAVHVPAGVALSLEGRVKWSRETDRGHAHGLEFVSVSEDSRRQLFRLLGR